MVRNRIIEIITFFLNLSLFPKGPRLTPQTMMVKMVNGRMTRCSDESFDGQNGVIHSEGPRKTLNRRYRAISHKHLPLMNQEKEDPMPKLNHNASVMVVSNKEQMTNNKQNIERGNNTFSAQQEKQYSQCKAAQSMIDSEVDSFININNIYFKHLKGKCICTVCNCGKHKCAFMKNCHLSQPFHQPQPQSIYKKNFLGKEGLKGANFDYGIYTNSKMNVNKMDQQSVNHSDFTKPDQKYYMSNPNFKPEQTYEHNPSQIGRSHYRRDFLEWGCAPYQPVKGYSGRTTIDAMPFMGQTTYNKDYHKMQACAPKIASNNYDTTQVKSPIPFLGTTTSNEYYKPYNNTDRVVKCKTRDELFTGAPSFKGQYQSQSKKEYIQFKNICPVDLLNDGSAVTPPKQI